MTFSLDMGAYGAYVWSSYAIGVAVLGGLAWWSWRRARVTAARLATLEEAAPHRRRRKEAADGA